MDEPQGVDLMMRCSCCGGWLWTSVSGTFNRWRCTACEGISKIENGVMEALPEECPGSAPDDRIVDRLLRQTRELPQEQVQREVSSWVAGRR